LDILKYLEFGIVYKLIIIIDEFRRGERIYINLEDGI